MYIITERGRENESENERKTECVRKREVEWKSDLFYGHACDRERKVAAF